MLKNIRTLAVRTDSTRFSSYVRAEDEVAEVAPRSAHESFDARPGNQLGESQLWESHGFVSISK